MKKEELLKAFGKHLRRIRKEKGLSLRELELRGEIDRQYISKLEQGKINLSFHRLKKLSDALGMKMSDLLKGF